MGHHRLRTGPIRTTRPLRTRAIAASQRFALYLRWAEPRWKGISRPCGPQDVARLRPSLVHDYSRAGMSAYVRLREKEFALADAHGYSAVRHQRFVGTGYFDAVQSTIAGGRSSTEARFSATPKC